MKKNNYLFIIKALLLLSMILFTACNHGLSSNNKVDTKKGIILVSVNTSGARTISPSIDIDAFDTFILKGKLGSTGTEQTLASGDTVAGLNSPAITLDAGTWTLTLTADLNGVTFSGTQSVTVSAGSTTPISFTLEPTVTTGAASIKINFSGDSNKVTLKFYQAGSTEPTTGDDGTITTGGSGSYVLANYTNKAAGTYILKAKFDKTEGSGANQKTYPLNTVTLTINVAAGLTTTHEMSIDLEQVYNITYHFIVNGEEVGSGTTIPDGSGITITSGALVDKYSRKGETITLPTLAKDGYCFCNWYDENLYTQIESIASNVTSGNQDYYACFADTIFVNGTNGRGLSPEHGAETIESALNLLTSMITPIDWKIAVVGEVTGCQEIKNDNLNSTTANSLTIKGNTGNTTDSLNGGNSTNDTGSTLTIDTTFPVNIQNLKITGGTGTTGNKISGLSGTTKYGGGLLVKQGTVTLGDGAVIQENTSDKGGGVCVVGTAVLNMSGSACIPPGTDSINNVYFTDQSKYINISGTITPPSDGIVAKYKIDSLTSDLTMLSGSDSNYVKTYFMNFGIIQNQPYSVNAYFINPQGKTDRGYIVNSSNYVTIMNGIDAGSTDVIKLLYVGDTFTNPSSKIKTQTCKINLDLSYMEGLTSIPLQAFYQCSNLYSITLPEGLTEIAQGAFRNCPDLVSVNLPSTVTTFGPYAFGGCTQLASIQIPKDMIYFGKQTFYESYALETITFQEGFSAEYLGGGEEDIYGYWPFQKCGVQNIEIPASVKYIGSRCFSECPDLTTVTFASGSNLESVGSNAFAQCDIQSITFPDNGKDITLAGYALYQNPSLTTLNLNSVKYLNGNYIFKECTSLQTVDLSNIMSCVEGETDISRIPYGAFQGDSALKTVTLSSTKDVIIGEMAFENCPIQAITNFNKITQIESKGFSQSSATNNVSLTELTIHEGITKLGLQSFYNWPLTKITFEWKKWKATNYSYNGGIIDLTDYTDADTLTYFRQGGGSNGSYEWIKNTD